MVEGRYIYSRDCKWPSEAIDVHHIIVRNSNTKGLFLCLFVLILFANSLYLLLMKDKSFTSFYWSFLLSASLYKLIHWKPVVKESVLVMPSFGAQLETEYKSGRIVRRFVPVSKILKPVLVECVTPITCYWSLSLILHEEAEQMLVFKELRPPLKMLVPVWKALCAACDGKDSSDGSTEES
uniref:Phosphatidylinositol N-acetylglucosaminyltransferase subunit H conserved domain-containing protein n=1 Tax=Rhizophora mucronata TaxID=61149 RepID=A0A2P2JNJ6_RHIMU